MEANPKKKMIVIIIVVVVVLMLAAGGYMIWKRLKEKKEEEAAKDDVKDIPEVMPPASTPPSGITKWTEEAFPLKKGMFGKRITNMQKKLGITADGKYGSGTEKAVFEWADKALNSPMFSGRSFVKEGISVTHYNKLIGKY